MVLVDLLLFQSNVFFELVGVPSGSGLGVSGLLYSSAEYLLSYSSQYIYCIWGEL